MRKAIAGSIDEYLNNSPDVDLLDEVAVDGFRSRAGVLASDCGCAIGGAFLAVTAVAAAVYLTVFGDLTATAVAIAVVVTFASAIVGKAVGIGAAGARLLLLRRRLRAWKAQR